MNTLVVLSYLIIIGTPIYANLRMKCYDCNSYGIHNPSPNQLCPANGTISGRFAEYLDEECQSFCMMSIRQNYMGDVFRGCYTIYPRVPWYTIPLNGCNMFEGNMYCKCIGHKCNNWNMEKRVKEFVEKYGWRW